VETALHFLASDFFHLSFNSFLQNLSTAFPSYKYKMRGRIAAQTFTAKPPLFLIRLPCGVMFQSGTLLPFKRFNYWSGLCAGTVQN
jgi:hypothetical protein